MKSLIIEDEKAAVRNLTAILTDVAPEIEIIGAPDSVADAIEWFASNPMPELVFMDIHLADGSAFEIFEHIQIKCPVIFTTAYDEYALRAFKVNSIDYLLKPISYPDFLKAANKALQWYEHMQAPAAEIESIFIKTEYKQVQVELRKILYIEGLKDYVKIFIEDEPHPILSLMSMKSLEEMLPASRFIRVHRSFIVQPEKIKVIERNRIVFGKEYIPISDNYKPRLVEFLAQRSLNFN